MKLPRPVVIARISVILIGAGIAFFYARSGGGLGETHKPLGNFDSKTQSLIAHSERVVFLIPFSQQMCWMTRFCSINDNDYLL